MTTSIPHFSGYFGASISRTEYILQTGKFPAEATHQDEVGIRFMPISMLDRAAATGYEEAALAQQDHYGVVQAVFPDGAAMVGDTETGFLFIPKTRSDQIAIAGLRIYQGQNAVLEPDLRTARKAARSGHGLLYLV